MAWNKLKSLFVTSSEHGHAPSGEGAASADASGLDPALAKYLVPEGGEPAPTLPPATDVTQLTGTIDFQGLYDQAGIPNTDEVESLERFLGGLDDQLPQMSKVAAAKAFLGAIGKAPSDVLADAERKVQVVRAVDASKRGDADAKIAEHQRRIDELQGLIDEQRAAIELSRKDDDSVRHQCTVEEARLQGARVFFGAMDAMKTQTTPAASPKNKA